MFTLDAIWLKTIAFWISDLANPEIPAAVSATSKIEKTPQNKIAFFIFFHMHVNMKNFVMM